MRPIRNSLLRAVRRSDSPMAAGSRKAALLLACLMFGSAHAQLPQTRLYSLFPPGGRAGQTVEVQVTSGDDLDELAALHFNHDGIKAVQKMQERGGKQVPVERTFQVTIGKDVPPGLYAARASGLFGMSNPRTFVVGDREEIQESEANNEREQADEIQLGQIVNGRSGGGADIDYYRFEGKKGQRIIATARAARIDSRMICTLELFDAEGNRIAFGKENVRQDPLIDITLPADGPYFLKVYDFVYGGGAEYFYRLSVGAGPHIDYVMPPAGLPGTTGTFTLFGRNLPGGEPAGVSIDGRPLQKLDVSISLPEEESVLDTVQNLWPVEASVDAVSYVHRTPQGNSNPVLIYLATAPVVLEQEPNDEPQQSQHIQVPAEYVGQFQAAGDNDLVTFEAKSGEVYYVEVFGQRCGTTADPYFVLEQVTKNDQGVESVKRIQAQDDNNANLAPNLFDTLTDDPIYRFQVPADGTYRITVRDRYFEVRGDPRLVYRLSIRKPQPDFRLAAVPNRPTPGNNQVAATWAAGLRKGDNFVIDVLAFRRDGFDEAIEVNVEGLPQGVRCEGAVIGPRQNRAALIVTADEDAPEWSGLIDIVGRVRFDDPEKKQAVQTAQAALNATRDELARLSPNAEKAGQEIEKAKAALSEALKAASSNPASKDLKQTIEQAQKAVEAAAGQAAAVKAAAEKKVAAAEAALKKAEDEYQASVRVVTRQARPGTIVWSGANNVPGTPRLAKSLGLSVLKEEAPFQVITDVDRVQVNQGRQILVPVKLAKRKGFDNNVNLQFVGLPNNSNIQVQNTQIAKGKDEALLRIFAKNNAAVGAYTLFLKTQGQVAYRRNPERAERAKAEQEKAAKALQQAAEAAKQAAQQRDQAVKKAEADAQALKKAEQAKTAAEKKAAEAQAAAKKAEEERDKAKQQAEAAEKAAKDDPENAEKAEQSKKAAEALEAAEKALQEAQQAAKKAADELAAAEKARAAAETAAKAAAETRTKAENAAKQAEQKRKAAEAAKKAADKQAQDAANAAKPKNTNVAPPSTPIIIEVEPAPAQLSASVPNGGNLKRGQQIEVKVTVKRTNNFKGPVTLTLPEVPGVTGVTAEPVTVPADQNQGVLTIRATGEATEGSLANMVIRGTMEFGGKAAVDVPINLKVSK